MFLFHDLETLAQFLNDNCCNSVISVIHIFLQMNKNVSVNVIICMQGKCVIFFFFPHNTGV